MEIRVLLADDHKILREGLKALLEREPGITVVGGAGDGEEAVRTAAATGPDVVVMDLNMPVMSGIEATRMITAADPQVRVIALSMVLDRESVVETLKAGARGYVLKDCAAEELLEAIHEVMKGENYLSSRITTMILTDYLQTSSPQAESPLDRLTPREQDILKLIADGRNTKEIAFDLGLSIKTVEARRLDLMKKLNLYSIAELTKLAIREGLTSVA